MTKVVREYFIRIHSRAFAQSFHIAPDVRTIQRISLFRREYRSLRPFLFLQIFFQQTAELLRQEYHSALPLVADLGASGPNRLDGDEFQLAHPDSGSADRLDRQR